MDRRDETVERGKPGSFDPATGEVHGSGSGAGGGNPGEDHDPDPMAGSGAEPEGGPRPASGATDATSGTGHPLPQSEESRRGEVPESLEREKGEGEEGREPARPDPVASDPDGEPYPT